MTTEKLIVELDADNRKLNAGLAKSERELDSFDDKTKKADVSLSKFTGAANVAGSAITAVASAVAIGTTAMVAFGVATGKSAQETENLARLAGVSAEEFKGLDYAMKRAGISAEKFGDQSKDAAERVGEFITSFEKTGKGTGPLNDFFDTLKLTEEQAYKTAQAMDHMSGDQILQFMVTEMEKAEVSAKQMSFAMESVASDTTLLIPLLKDGGKELKALKDEFNGLNNELSDREKQNYIDFANNMNALTTSFSSFMQNALAPFIPMMNAATMSVAEFFAEWNTELDLDRLGDAIKEGGLEQLFADADTIKEIEAFNAQLETLASQQMKMVENRQAALDAQAEQGPVIVEGRGGETQEQFDERMARMQHDIDTTRDYYDQIKQAQADFASYQEEQRDEAGTGDPQEPEGTVLPTGKTYEVQLEVEQEYYDQSLGMFTTHLEKKSKAEQKAESDSAKLTESYQKKALAMESSNAKSIIAIGQSLAGENDAVTKGLFIASQGLAASEVFFNTQAASVRALAELGPIAGAPVAAAIETNGYIKMAAIAAQTLGGLSSSGGGSSGSIGSSGSTSSGASEQQSVTGEVEINESIGSGGQTSNTSNTVTITAEDGDELAEAFASVMNKKLNSGEITLG